LSRITFIKSLTIGKAMGIILHKQKSRDREKNVRKADTESRWVVKIGEARMLDDPS